MLASYSWAWGMTWSVVDTPSDTPLEKKNLFFSFPSRYQFQISSWMGLELCVTFPFLSAGILSGLNPCRSCVCWHRLYEFTCVSVLFCLGDPFLWHHPPPLALIIFLPSLLHRSLHLERKDLINLVLSVQKSLTHSLIHFTLSSLKSLF